MKMNTGRIDVRTKNIKSITSLAVLSACFLVSLMMSGKVEAASQCKSAVGAYSYSVSKTLARKQARMVWRGLVIQKYDVRYAVWRLGKDRSSSCKRKWNGTVRCTVRAKPCR